MYSVSSNFNAAATANARQILVRAYVNETLLTGDNLIDLTVTEAVNASGGLSIGTTISSKLTAKIKMPETPLLLTDSIIRPEVSFYGVDEWVPLGKFYVTDAVSDNDFNTSDNDSIENSIFTFHKTNTKLLADLLLNEKDN